MKSHKNKLFDCTIIQDLCYTLSNYKQIVQIYKETETRLKDLILAKSIKNLNYSLHQLRLTKVKLLH